eukprot:6529281-Karenia_brevis.AAC.1
MRCPNNQWPQADNNPTIGVELDYQSVPEVDTRTAKLVWKGEHVKTHCPPPPPPRKPAVERGTPSNVTLDEMLNIVNLASKHHNPPTPEDHEAEQDQLSPQGRKEAKHQQLIALQGEDWLEGPQGTMRLAEMLTAAGFEVGRGHSP